MNIQFTDNSKEVSDNIKAALLRGLETCGLVAEGYAKKLTPVGTPESTEIPESEVPEPDMPHELVGNYFELAN